MRILPATLPLLALAISACANSGPPGSQHADAAAKADTVVVSRTYETRSYPTYVTPEAEVTATYVSADGTVTQEQAIVPQTYVVEPRTTLIEERRYYNDDYVGRANSQAERQALSRKFYNSCPPGAAKDRAC